MQQPDLYLSDPSDNWAAVSQAKKEGNMELLTAFPVIYTLQQDELWEGLSYSVIKALCCTFTDHGLGVPYTMHLIQSYMH